MSQYYKSDPYSRLVQRFIYPLYIKDGLGGFDFSSTMTFVTYKNESFCIFAAHALPLAETTVDNVGALSTDGSFMPLGEVTKSYRIHRDHDVVICNTIAPFEQKNYFELDIEKTSTEFNGEKFGWIGFPKKKAKQTYHKTKSSKEHILKYLSVLEDGTPKWNNADFLLIGVTLESENDSSITGKFKNTEVEYQYEGFKQHGYSLKGMSGGAMFYGPKKINEEELVLNDLYKFAGIGLEYDDKIVTGASKNLIVSLLENFMNKGS